MPAPSLDGRRFRDASAHHQGDVGSDTVFSYHQSDDLVWADYCGGAIRLGYLVGTRDGDSIEFRYAHVTTTGETATGHCASTVRELEDGRLRLEETWQWESKVGEGTSVVEEILPG